MGSPAQEVHEVRDDCGRTYRVGEQPRDIMGRSRVWMLWLCWSPMLVVGASQYAYGAALPTMAAGRGRPVSELLWPLAMWTIFQAGASYPVAHLRQRHRLGPRAVMLAGAALCLIGVLALAHAQSLLGVLIGYSVLGGTGAGLVYATCTSTVAKWYPERSAGRVSLVTGAFAYGSIPLVVALVLGADTRNLPIALDSFGMLLFAVVLACGLLMTDPPRNWWPSHIDPRQWALSRHLNPGRLRNPPAIRQYTVAETLRAPVLSAMYACLFCAGSVSLFNAALLIVFTSQLGYGPWTVALAAAAFVGVNGAGRSLAIRASDRGGRRRVLVWTLGIQGTGQFCLMLAAAGSAGSVLVLGTVLAGIGGGAFYPLFASLTREYFGEQSTAEVHGVVYSAKAFSGVAGVSMAVLALGTAGHSLMFLVAGLLALCSAALTRTLRRPGLPRTLP